MTTHMMNRVAATAAAAALLVTGLLGGYWWAQHKAGRDSGSTASKSLASSKREALYWYDPMVPDQHFDKPGKSPFMDMPLVPKYGAEVAGTGVRISASLQQNVGIRTAIVEVGSLVSTVRAPGTLTWDLRQESVVSARTEGLVTRIWVKAPYTSVTRGEPLAAIVAPGWSGALAEANALQQAQSASARELQAAAQQRLRVLGVPSGMGGDGSMTLSAPRSGIITEVLVREGQAVEAGTPLFRVNGTSTLWLEAAIPQAATAGLRVGTPIEATFSALPGRVFSGQLQSLLPQVDVASRTQSARIVLPNPDGLLAPGMFADVSLRPAANDPVPLLPSEALIATGADSRVIVHDADGGFRPVRVRTGHSSGDRTEILAGLTGGERVVVSGQFLIDSEASLSGALERLGDVPLAAARPTPGTMVDAGRPPLPTAPTKVPPLPQPRHEQAPASSTPVVQPSRSCLVSYWYDPMKPEVHFDKPGKSPFMEMQLVPKFAPGAAPDCTIQDAVSTTSQVQP